MNKDFLEFWGNFLLQAAKGQRQLEEAMKWAQLGFESIEEQRDFWNSFGAVKKEIENKPGNVEIWEKSLEDYRKSYREFVKFFGMVPMEEYQALLKKNEALEKKLAEQKETLPKARSARKETLDVQREIEKGLQELIQKQGEQFKELTGSIAKYYGRSPANGKKIAR
jgi:hypothetical protein